MVLAVGLALVATVAQVATVARVATAVAQAMEVGREPVVWSCHCGSIHSTPHYAAARRASQQDSDEGNIHHCRPASWAKS